MHNTSLSHGSPMWSNLRIAECEIEKKSELIEKFEHFLCLYIFKESKENLTKIQLLNLRSLFQFHIQLFLNYFTLVNRETMMYYAKEFRILQLRRIITRWCCRIIQVLRLFNSVLFGTRSYKFFVSNFNFFADLIIQQLKL